MQPFRSSGPEIKNNNFFIFFVILEKLHMQWQYDPQKAQLEHKLQLYAQIHNESTIVFAQWSGKESMTPCQPPTRPFTRQTRHPPTHSTAFKSVIFHFFRIVFQIFMICTSSLSARFPKSCIDLRLESDGFLLDLKSQKLCPNG